VKRGEEADWARELGIKVFTPDTEYLYAPCCAPAYDVKADVWQLPRRKLCRKLA